MTPDEIAATIPELGRRQTPECTGGFMVHSPAPAAFGRPAVYSGTRQARSSRTEGSLDVGQQVRAVVARAVKEPVSLEVDRRARSGARRGPRAGAGLRRVPHRPPLPGGRINDEFPFLLGHEAAGVVEAVGPDVTDVAPGDFVILNWRAVCGECRSCRRGRPWYCFSTHNATQKMTLDGVPLSPALGIGAFAEKTLVAAGQCTKVSPEVQARGRRPARLRGHGRPRRGHAHRRGRRGRLGGRVRLRRRRRRRHRGVARWPAQPRSSPSTSTPGSSSWPREFGATHVVDASKVDPVEAIRDADRRQRRRRRASRPSATRRCSSRPSTPGDLAGTVVQVGVPNPEMRIDLPMIDFFGRGGRLKPSWYGDCLPSRDFPLLVDLHLQGRLALERFVTETIDLDEVEEAFHKMERGEVLRSVVVLG